MPIYEYKCPACGKVVEVIQHTWRDDAPICCTTRVMERLPGVSTPQFKGTGWYETDYRGKS